MEAAARWGVSWRRFNGWEPTETTVYEYDQQSRLVRSVTTSEPEWDEDGRAYATSLVIYEHSLCACGWPQAMTTGPESDGRFHPGEPVVCYRCRAIERGAEDVKDDPQRGAMRFSVTDHGPQARRGFNPNPLPAPNLAGR